MAVNATGREMLIEDCLDKQPDGRNLPLSQHPSIDILNDPAHCPLNFYRTGTDNGPHFLGGMMNTLLSMEPFLNKTSPVPASRPGCWAYPDMLGIGKTRASPEQLAKKGCPPLTFAEEETLFATWAIVSAPLILSFDVKNDTEVERLWPIIANKRALAVNAEWAGEAGHVLKRSGDVFDAAAHAGATCNVNVTRTFPSWVVWVKRLAADEVAVLAINLASAAQSISVMYDDLTAAGAGGGGAALLCTDVWTNTTCGLVTSASPWRLGSVPPHSSNFAVFSPANAA